MLGRLSVAEEAGGKGLSPPPHTSSLPLPTSRRPPRIPEDAAGRGLKLPRLDGGAAGGGYSGSRGCALSTLEPTLDPIVKEREKLRVVGLELGTRRGWVWAGAGTSGMSLDLRTQSMLQEVGSVGGSG